MSTARKLQPDFSPESSPARSHCSLSHYEIIRNKLVSLTGIELGANKQALVESRLLKRISALKLSDISQYVRYLENTPSEVTSFINCLTTNKTDWFREPKHFSYLTHEVLPEIYKTPRIESAAAGKRMVYVWSAASSTGEEVYTLAMTLKEHLKENYDFRVLGTDIDTDILSKAAAATYNAELVRSQVPVGLQNKYFCEDSANRALLRVRPELSQHTKFRSYNLIEGTLASEIRFDVIFLRNVLIYFTPQTVEQVIRRVCRYLKPGGYLFTGHSESLNGISHSLEQVSESVYRLKG